MKNNEYPQFPDKREMGKTKLEQTHLILFRMLQIFDTICKKYDIDYWLDYGTLLGAVRHKGFIPWDPDLDLGILRSDYQMFLEKGITELPLDIFFQDVYSDPYIGKHTWMVEGRLRDRYSSNYYNPVASQVNWHSGIQLDLFVYDEHPEECVTNVYERFLNNGKVYLRFEEIESLDKMIFEGYEFPVPIGYHKYLERCYGDYMTPLPVEKREDIKSEPFVPCDHFASLDWKKKI